MRLRMLAQQDPTGFSPEGMMGGAIPNPRGLGMSRFTTGVHNGLGRLQNALFPTDPGMDPRQAKAMQNQALLQLGLGMISAKSQGAGLGQSLAHGFGGAQQTLQGSMQRAFQNAQMKQAQARADNREDRMMQQQELQAQRYDAEQAHRLEREKLADERYTADREHELEREKTADERWKAQHELSLKQFQAQIDGATRSADVRVTDRGLFERDKNGKWNLVPGTEPTGVAGRPIPQGMANDLKANASVMDQIDQLLPQIRDPETKEFSKEAKDAFGAGNAVIGMLTPDAITDNVKNVFDSKEAVNLRALVTNMNSYIVKERNGSAVTVAEFARQRGFLPTDSDSPEVIERKLQQLRDAVSSEQQYMLDFAESQGYKTPPARINRESRGGTGNWTVEEER
jgi:hypothetical protein